MENNGGSDLVEEGVVVRGVFVEWGVKDGVMWEERSKGLVEELEGDVGEVVFEVGEKGVDIVDILGVVIVDVVGMGEEDGVEVLVGEIVE